MLSAASSDRGAGAAARDRRPPARPGPSAATADASASDGPTVAPFARALALLSAFTPQDRWLSNGELAHRAGIPASTVTRLSQTLVALGYLVHEPAHRRYRLAAAVLGLGYAAFANSDVQRVARARMQAFADQHRVHVTLSSRDRLDLIVLESCRSAGGRLALNLHVGVRVGLASSPMGWALLAALPDAERHYLLNNVERRMPREWAKLRRRANEALEQVHEKGYCCSLGEWDAQFRVVAVPVLIDGCDPRVLACVGPSADMGRARAERELGPSLLGIARQLRQAAGSE